MQKCSSKIKFLKSVVEKDVVLSESKILSQNLQDVWTEWKAEK